MEKKGLIRKNKDLDKKNMVRISLTQKGNQKYNEVLKRESIRHILLSLNGKEKKQLRATLFLLREKAMEYLGIEQDTPYPPRRTGLKM